jgi:hypothetical protein
MTPHILGFGSNSLLPSSSTPPVNNIVDSGKLTEDKSEDFAQATG